MLKQKNKKQSLQAKVNIKRGVLCVIQRLCLFKSSVQLVICDEKSVQTVVKQQNTKKHQIVLKTVCLHLSIFL
jgi:hypothetical protein